MKLQKFVPIFLAFVVFVLHIILTNYNLPLRIVFSGFPVSSIDYDTHIAQTVRVVTSLDKFKKSWVWEPRFNAGFPEGTIFDGDNKGHTLFVYLLYKFGISLPVAFNLFILLGHLLPPFVFFAAARLLGGNYYSSIISAFFASMVWNFDALTRWAWWVGMISYAMVSCLAPLAFALFYRFVLSGKVRYIVCLCFLLPALHLIHPLVLIILFVPMLVTYIMFFKKISISKHIMVLGMCLITVLVNLFWIIVCIKFLKFVTGSEVFGRARWWFFFTDYLGIVADTAEQALVAMRTGWRFLIFMLAGIIIVKWKKTNDPRFMPFAITFVFLLLFSYTGRYFPVLKHMQPYRHIVPVTFMTIVPAAICVEWLINKISKEKISDTVAIVIWVLALIALPHLIRDAIYFIPQLKPAIVRPEPGLPNISDTLGFGSIGWPEQQEYRHGLARDDYWAVRDWVVQHDDGTGRFLVTWWILGEFLAWTTNSQIIGGFRFINLKHGFANIFRTYYYEPPPEKYFREYIKRYGVKYLIASGAPTSIEYHKHLLKNIDFVPPNHRIYLLDPDATLFLKGDGKVRATLNRIEVTEASGDEIILKYHYHNTFVCKPGCKVEKYDIPFDPIGFIKIPRPPVNFVIENAY